LSFSIVLRQKRLNMNVRVLGAIASMFFAAANAQVAEAPQLRAAMSATAAKLLQSVEGGPGPIERMAGFDRGASLEFALDDPQRQNWQYWPAQRIGLAVGLMTVEQRMFTHELLSDLLSSSGYLKATQIMQLEQILGDTDEAGFPRAVGHYTLSIFGDPGDSDWAWRFEGHHVSLSVTVGEGGITVTPSFFGSNPAEIRTGPLAGLRVHGGLEDMARELVESLSGPERRLAVVSERAPFEMLTSQVNLERDKWGAWLEALQPEGIGVRDLNEVQQHWVRRMLDEVVGNYREELAFRYLEQIDPLDLSFAWMGATERGQPHYFRLQGEDFVFEYDNVQNGGNHVHSVWRSKGHDFGAGALADHYSAVAH
jgi:hypothetical protein